MSRELVPDAHCHLGDLPDPGLALEEAHGAGVGPVLAVAMGPDDGERVLDWKRRRPGLVLAGLGLHPSRVPALTDGQVEEEIEAIERRIGEADVVGEIGLDFKDAREPEQRRRQRRVLERLLRLAEAARRPVNLHTRRADRELLERASDFTRRTGLSALLHWFTHSRELAALGAGEGLYLSAGPSVLFDERQLEVARTIEADLLLVETDAPVLYGGLAASPGWAVRVAGALARARGEAPEAMAARLARNMARYLRRDITSPAGTTPPSRPTSPPAR
ncbi:MAG TPA: TatD family hydrolase [Candidatus Polarisedimenticolia bacterium]|nr:TatD family hydrolase [Candidatus Polarisedimenticolia bacterium]